jgi:hypothetical protein
MLHYKMIKFLKSFAVLACEGIPVLPPGLGTVQQFTATYGETLVIKFFHSLALKNILKQQNVYITQLLSGTGKKLNKAMAEGKCTSCTSCFPIVCCYFVVEVLFLNLCLIQYLILIQVAGGTYDF